MTGGPTLIDQSCPHLSAKTSPLPVGDLTENDELFSSPRQAIDHIYYGPFHALYPRCACRYFFKGCAFFG